METTKICKNCKKTIILTDDLALKNLNQRQGYCSYCWRTGGLGKVDQLQKDYKLLLQARSKYFQLLHGKHYGTKDNVLDQIEDYYGVDLIVVLNDRFTEFFCMGEDGNKELTFERLLELIKDEKKRQEEDENEKSKTIQDG